MISQCHLPCFCGVDFTGKILCEIHKKDTKKNVQKNAKKQVKKNVVKNTKNSEISVRKKLQEQEELLKKQEEEKRKLKLLKIQL